MSVATRAARARGCRSECYIHREFLRLVCVAVLDDGCSAARGDAVELPARARRTEGVERGYPQSLSMGAPLLPPTDHSSRFCPSCGAPRQASAVATIAIAGAPAVFLIARRQRACACALRGSSEASLTEKALALRRPSLAHHGSPKRRLDIARHPAQPGSLRVPEGLQVVSRADQ